MKTKVILGLALCCLLSSLLTTVITNNVQAQMQVAPGPAGGPYELYAFPPMNVVFPEDPFRQHGLQVTSYRVISPFHTDTLVFTVPVNKKFIITDIVAGSMDENGDIKIDLRTDGSLIKFATLLSRESGLNITISSGVEYGPGQNIYLWHDYPTGSTGDADLTISGYYVDL